MTLEQIFLKIVISGFIFTLGWFFHDTWETHKRITHKKIDATNTESNKWLEEKMLELKIYNAIVTYMKDHEKKE